MRLNFRKSEHIFKRDFERILKDMKSEKVKILAIFTLPNLPSKSNRLHRHLTWWLSGEIFT